jgi:hypothetical protein
VRERDAQVRGKKTDRPFSVRQREEEDGDSFLLGLEWLSCSVCLPSVNQIRKESMKGSQEERERRELHRTYACDHREWHRIWRLLEGFRVIGVTNRRELLGAEKSGGVSEGRTA